MGHVSAAEHIFGMQVQLLPTPVQGTEIEDDVKYHNSEGSYRNLIFI